MYPQLAVAAQDITLTFNVHQTAGSPAAWAYLDEVTLGPGAYPDLWLSTRHYLPLGMARKVTS